MNNMGVSYYSNLVGTNLLYNNSKSYQCKQNDLRGAFVVNKSFNHISENDPQCLTLLNPRLHYYPFGEYTLCLLIVYRLSRI